MEDYLLIHPKVKAELVWHAIHLEDLDTDLFVVFLQNQGPEEFGNECRKWLLWSASESYNKLLVTNQGTVSLRINLVLHDLGPAPYDLRKHFEVFGSLDNVLIKPVRYKFCRAYN
jgi:hypothetical protein